MIQRPIGNSPPDKDRPSPASARKPTRRTEDLRWARGRERASPEHAHKSISPIGSTGSLPPRLTVREEESPGLNDREAVRQRPEWSSGFRFN